MNDDRVTYFAETDARNKRIKFGIKAKDRTKHVYVIGKTGMGKSTLLENMAVQDIQNGEGLAFVDPHGKTADLLLEYVPEHRIKDVVYFAPFDLENPISFNVLENVDADKRHLVVSGLMSTFKKIWKDAWSARMEYILTNSLLALLEYPESTLLGVNRMLSDKDYRKKVVDNVKDPSVKSFWVDEFAKYTDRMAAEAVPAIQNKIGQFTSNPLIRNMVGQVKSSFNLRDIMDKRKILIVNLSKGRIGDTNANLLGGMMITKIYLAAMSRADIPDMVMKKMPNFYLFVDEFQNFANESFADILSEARKYKLNLTIAHQYIEQMEEEVRAAVFGNVGTMITFRVGAYDAEVLEKEFAPTFTAEDIVNLGFAQIYLKLMIDGVSSQPFSATTLGPIPKPQVEYVKDVIEESRRQFSMSRTEIEAQIVDWHKPTVPSAPVAKKNPTGNPAAPAAKSDQGPKSSPQNYSGQSSSNSNNSTSQVKQVPSIKPAPMPVSMPAPMPNSPSSFANRSNASVGTSVNISASTNTSVDKTADIQMKVVSKDGEAVKSSNSVQAPSNLQDRPSSSAPSPLPRLPKAQGVTVSQENKKTEPQAFTKPFAGLKDLLKTLESSKTSTIPVSAPLSPSAGFQGVNNPSSPSSGSNLSQKSPVQSVQRDRKGPSEKNINDLKSVLAGLNKAPVPAPAPVSVAVPVSNNPAPITASAPVSTPVVATAATATASAVNSNSLPIKPTQNEASIKGPEIVQNKPAEIPHDELVNMLKV